MPVDVNIFVSILNFAATVSIAIVLNRIRSESETLQNTQNLNRQWQDFNLLMLSQTSSYDTLRSLKYEDGTDQDIRARHLIYYVLNILYDTWKLSAHGIVDQDFAKTTIRGQMRILAGSQQILRPILLDTNLYDPAFRGHCLRVLDEKLK